MTKVDELREKILPVLLPYGVKRVALFGSVMRERKTEYKIGMSIASGARFLFALIALSLSTACSQQAGALTSQRAQDIAWQALDPNTTSHDRAYWEFTEAKQVKGGEVAGQFKDNPAPGCWAGPTPPANATIAASDSYWFVRAERRAMTAVPQKRTVSPTEPPAIPDAFMYKALFLIDVQGKVVAQQLSCVIY
jgi:hypothetical protein